MSSGNKFERLLRQISTVLKLVVDGKRDPEDVSALLQGVIDGAKEKPAAMPIGEASVLLDAKPPSTRLETVATVTTGVVASEGQLVALLQTPVGQLPLRYEPMRRLFGVGLRFLGNVVVLTAEELSQRCCFDAGALKEIQAMVAGMGSQLGMKLEGSLQNRFKTQPPPAGQYAQISSERFAPLHPSIPRSEAAYHGSRFRSGEW